jgi:hypothetical protein
MLPAGKLTASKLGYNDEIVPSCRAAFAACQRGVPPRRASPSSRARSHHHRVRSLAVLAGRATHVP